MDKMSKHNETSLKSNNCMTLLYYKIVRSLNIIMDYSIISLHVRFVYLLDANRSRDLISCGGHLNSIKSPDNYKIIDNIVQLPCVGKVYHSYCSGGICLISKVRHLKIRENSDPLQLGEEPAIWIRLKTRSFIMVLY